MAGQTFTTYINAKRSGSVEAEFAALGARGERELGRLQTKAEAVNRAMAGLTGGRGRGGLGASPVSQAYLGGFDNAKQRADKLSESTARLARENSVLVRSLRTTGQTLQVVQGPLGPIAGRVTAAADAIARLSGVSLGMAGAGAALFAYARAANRFVEIRSRLAPLYETQEQVNKALGDVAGIAQRARSGLEPVVDLYAKMKLAADQFGISQGRVNRLTELASKAATLSGGTAQSREAGLYQFAQGFGSGTLAGDELKSIRENTLALAKAISDGLGKLPEFKGVDTSIGKLKELGAAGKLTADVIARALEASASDIEKRFAKLPPTISSAMTSAGTSATMFIGRFEEATGVVGTLATGIKLVGDNLNIVASLLGGVAAGWAAVALASKASDIGKAVSGQIQVLQAQRAAAQQALVNATNQKRMIDERVAAYGGEKRAIQANIAALESELATQKALATEARMQTRANPAGPGRRLAQDADDAAYLATQKLAQERDRLSVVNGRLEKAEGRVATATDKVAVAKDRAARSASLLRAGASSLLAAINPLGIAVGLATVAFLNWAMSESAAEKAAGKLEEAQRTLATVIDLTTGKVIEQNAALIANANLQGRQAVQEAGASYTAQRAAIAALGRSPSAAGASGGMGQGFNPAGAAGRGSISQQQARGALQAYGAPGSQMTTAQLTQVLNGLAKVDPSLRGLADRVTELGAAAVKTRQGIEQTRAQLDLLAGKNDAETRRRASGDFSGGRSADQAASGKTDAQIAADVEALRKRLRDKRYAAEVQMNEQLGNLETRRSKLSVDAYTREKAQIMATYDSAIAGLDKQDQAAARRAEREEQRRQRAHERELARIEAENQARAQRTEKRSDILQQWSEEPKAIVKAKDQIDDLNKLIGKTMNGLVAITEDNPLGQGIYTAEMAAGDAARIEEGLQRPYNKYMEARQQELNIQELLLAGRDLEAEALRVAYDLYGDVGRVTMDQYESILNNLRAEERINDALEQRERLIAPLRESVGKLREDITGAIEDFLGGGNPLKGLKNIVKGLFASFNHASAVQLAEKITGGLDARVRELIRGSVQVDTKIADYIGALDQGGLGADRLTNALDNAANAANNAAGALNGVAGSPGVQGGGAGGALGAAGSSIMGAAASSLYGLMGASLPRSFYKPGVQVGGGAGDDIIFKALGSLGAVITDNLRSPARQAQYYSQGLSTARVGDHTRTNEAWDVRLPAGMSFAKATELVKKQAAEMGYSLIKALDETAQGGTGRHAHYVFGRGGGAGNYAGYGGLPDDFGAVGGAIGGMIGGSAPAVVQAINGLADFGKRMFGNGSRSMADKDAEIMPDGTVVVTGTRRAKDPQQGVETPVEHYNKMGAAIGASLDKILGTKFLAGIGKHLGTVLQGAQTGAMASGFAKMLGLKQSNTGAMIGGAIGSLATLIPGVGPLVGPIASAIGGLIGGTIGGMFKKTKKASSTITGSGGAITVGEATGNSGKREAAASGMAGSVGDALQRIAEQLDVTIGNFAVSIGMRKDKYVVDPTGRGKTKHVPKFDTEEEAIRYALMDAIKDGALQGLSAASNTILKKAKDLERALNKVMVIESIPKRLMALKDPVRFAVTELNREFAQMIAYLKEGGATAAQFAEAQELYDLERQKAIEQATSQSIGALQDYINEMLGGSSSPLNRATVYQNAASTLSGFQTDVAAGKVVDTDDLLKAVANFQEASQGLYGSSQSFFDDFNMLLGLLNQAKTNVGGAIDGTTTNLPASPFDDPGIQAIISGTASVQLEVRTQGDRAAAILERIAGFLGGSYTGGGSTAIGQLPGSTAPAGSSYTNIRDRLGSMLA
jgi:tape measure domain-containing protein